MTSIRTLLLEMVDERGASHIRELHIEILRDKPGTPEHTIRARLSEAVSDGVLNRLTILTALLVSATYDVPLALAHDYVLPGGTSPDAPPDPEEGEQPPENNPATGAEPVYLHSGEYSLGTTDVRIPARGLPITIRRTYRSFSAYNSRFGYGWDLNVNMRLRELADGNVILLDGRNRKVDYALNGGDYISPPGRYDTLVKNPDGTFTLTGKHKTRHEFDENGNLTAIVDRNGNTLTFSYEEGGDNGLFPITGPSDYFVDQTRGLVAMEYKLTTITDATGRQVNFSYNADGLLSSITDFAGRTWTYSYDPQTNDLLAVTAPATPEFPSGTTVTYAYENHRLISITDQKGQVYLTNQYDADGRVETQVFGPATFTFSYDPVNNRTTVTDGRGIQTRTTYNDNGNPTEVTVYTKGWRPGDPASFTTTYQYNTDMERTNTTYPRGNQVVMVYDSLGNTLSRTLVAAPGTGNPPNIVSACTYNSEYNFVETITDPRGNVTTFAYDPANGNLLSITQPEVGGQTPVTHFTYNAYGQVETATDPEGLVTKYEYDPATGYRTRVIRNFGGTPEQVTHYTHDAVGNTTSITDANGHTTTYMYNAQDQLTQEVSPLGYVTNYSHDANGNLIQVNRQMEGGDGWQTTTYTYTIRDNLETVTDDMGHVTMYTYDAGENVVSVEDAEHHTTTYDHDERDFLWKVTDALSHVTQYGYDLNGNLASLTDARGNTTTFEYDGFDRLWGTIYPESSPGAADQTTEICQYDPAGNLTRFTNRRGQAITFTYDALNRRTTKARPDTGTITYSYDLTGRLLTASATQGTLTNSYDSLGRLQQVIDVNSKAVAYEYDLAGNRKTLTYPDGYPVTYEYDAMNRLLRIKPPAVGPFAPEDLDEDGDVDQADVSVFRACMTGANITPGPGCENADLNNDNDVDQSDFGLLQAALTGPELPGTYIGAYSYDALSRRTEARYANDTSVTYQYDTTDRLQSLVNQVLPANLSFAYAHDDVGNRLTMTVNGADTHTYGYDNIYQLTSVDYPDGFFQQDKTYNYDELGNRISVVNGGTTTYVPNNLNQYGSVGGTAYSYDNSGNLTSDGINTYVYDSENRLASATTPSHAATYAYDTMGRRIAKTVDGVTTRFVYDGFDVIAEYNDSDQILRRFVHGARVDEPVRMDRATTPGGPAFEPYYYHFDGLGSVIALTDSAGQTAEQYTYDVYGSSDSASSVDNLSPGGQNQPGRGG